MQYQKDKAINGTEYTLLDQTQAASELAASGISTPNLEARLLWEHSCTLGEAAGPRFFAEAIVRRKKHEPIAYIIGKKAFWRHEFTINSEVLIPRPDSEILLEVALGRLVSKYANTQQLEHTAISAAYKRSTTTKQTAINEAAANQHITILELGVGSGCILLSLIHELKDLGIACHGFGLDISIGAIELAKVNVANLGLQQEITLIQSDWFSNIAKNIKFDAIIANPPYIPMEEWRNLNQGVREFEPQIALTDNADGLSHYRHIAACASDFMQPGGFLALECGYNQADRIQAILQHNAGWSSPEITHDLAGIARVVAADFTPQS